MTLMCQAQIGFSENSRKIPDFWKIVLIFIKQWLFPEKMNASILLGLPKVLDRFHDLPPILWTTIYKEKGYSQQMAASTSLLSNFLVYL